MGKQEQIKITDLKKKLIIIGNCYPKSYLWSTIRKIVAELNLDELNSDRPRNII